METTETQCCTAGTVTAGKVHAADCKPDALTGLEALVRENASQMFRPDDLRSLISEARKEMEAKQRVVDTLSAKMGYSVRQGQQQGRVELAQEILEEIDDWDTSLESKLERIISEDAGQ